MFYLRFTVCNDCAINVHELLGPDPPRNYNYDGSDGDSERDDSGDSSDPEVFQRRYPAIAAFQRYQGAQHNGGDPNEALTTRDNFVRAGKKD